MAVEHHLSSGNCVGEEGGEERRKAEVKRRKERGEVCWKRGCAKSLIVGMRCLECQHLFCATHRHASEHACLATPSSSSSSSRAHTPQPPTSSLSRLIASTSRPNPPSQPVKAFVQPSKPSIQPSNPPRNPIPISTHQLEARAAAAAAAMKRAGQDVKVPFVKTKVEKRSQSELNSSLQALKHRQQKGLLSKAEEVKYAELLAVKEGERKAGKKDGDGCVVC
ncbi:hypothetical protein P7C73_g2641, partial [Tremellales sp. Uapishka_1]